MNPTVYHLIPRVTAGEFLIETEHERNVYLRLLGDALRMSDWKCIAYAVMSNHVHLTMVAGKSPRSWWMNNAHSPFGSWINRRNERCGSVFIKDPTTIAVAPEDMASCIAYLHNNPVRAGVATKASESSWTSHLAYQDACEPFDWLDVDLGRALMNLRDPRSFDDFVRSEASRPRHAPPKRGRPRRR